MSFANTSIKTPSKAPVKTPAKSSIKTSTFDKKRSILEKYLKSKMPFEKKTKILISFQKWTDKEVFSNVDKMSEDELSQLMQYSNLLKALSPQKLTPKNCKSAKTKVLEEDASPLNENPSPVAQSIVHWLQLICTK